MMMSEFIDRTGFEPTAKEYPRSKKPITTSTVTRTPFVRLSSRTAGRGSSARTEPPRSTD